MAEAELQGEPSKPDQLTDFGCLIGKIIAPQSGGSFAVIQMVTDTFFVGTSVSDHGHLGGLDDDDHPQYHNDARALTWINTQSVNEMSDVATTGEAKNDVLMFNGTNYVPVPEGTTFTFSCTSFSDGEGTTQLIGTGDWKAAELLTSPPLMTMVLQLQLTFKSLSMGLVTPPSILWMVLLTLQGIIQTQWLIQPLKTNI